jgi:hypothetical protein
MSHEVAEEILRLVLRHGREQDAALAWAQERCS